MANLKSIKAETVVVAAGRRLPAMAVLTTRCYEINKGNRCSDKKIAQETTSTFGQESRKAILHASPAVNANNNSEICFNIAQTASGSCQLLVG